jgi:hypothetical protein
VQSALVVHCTQNPFAVSQIGFRRKQEPASAAEQVWVHRHSC